MRYGSRECTMTKSTDLDEASFQAVLKHLTSEDLVSLRQVSRSVCKLTNRLLPYICLRLSEGTRLKHLKQWCRATRQLQGVAIVRMYISGKVDSKVFAKAVEKLSERPCITELHVVAATVSQVSNSSDNNTVDVWTVKADKAHIPTLASLKLLFGQLRTLVIQGITVDDLSKDLEKLSRAAAEQHEEAAEVIGPLTVEYEQRRQPTGVTEAAASAVPGQWQLQRLTIDIDWRCVDSDTRPWPPEDGCIRCRFSLAMQHMVEAFPHLQQLCLRMPESLYSGFPFGIKAKSAEAYADDDDYDYTTIVTDYDEQHYTWLDEADYDEDIADHDVDNNYVATGAASVAAVTALISGTLQLHSLQKLVVTNLPDVWKPHTFYPFDQPTVHTSAIQITAKVPEANFETISPVPPAAAAAAAAFWTMDDCGGWLLQHHRKLQDVLMTTARGCTMAWQQQVQQPLSAPAGSGNNDLSVDSLAAGLVALRARWSTNAAPRDMIPIASDAELSDDSDMLENDSIRVSMLSSARFMNYLSHYSSRAAPILLRSVSSCQLRLYHHEVHDLANLLGDLKSLRNLELKLARKHGTDAAVSAAAAGAAVTMAAAVQTLESLSLYVQGQHHVLPDDFLLPLTAAAGGPGSSLKKLKLIGNFDTTTASTGSGTTGTIQGLSLLTGLLELSIGHKGLGGSYCLSVDSLPASLQVFKGFRLSLSATGRMDTVGGDDGCAGMCSQAAPATNFDAANVLQLRVLDLKECELSSPSLLASHQLQHLSVIDSSWSGDWQIAAAAWPNVRNLIWKYNDVLVGNGNSSDIDRLTTITIDSTERSSRQLHEDAEVAATASSVVRVLQHITAGFASMRYVMLLDVPCLFIEILKTSTENFVSMRYFRLVESEDSRWLRQEGAEQHTSSDDERMYRSCSEIIKSAQLQRIVQSVLPWTTVSIEECHSDFMDISD